MSIVITKGPNGETVFAFCATTQSFKNEVNMFIEQQAEQQADQREIGVIAMMSRNELLKLLNE